MVQILDMSSCVVSGEKGRLMFNILFICQYLFVSHKKINHFSPAIRARFFKFCTKKIREKSRECHNHKPQPFPDPKRKRKATNLNKHKPNKRTKSTKISCLFPKRGNRNTKRTEKHKNKMTHTERHTTNRLEE